MQKALEKTYTGVMDAAFKVHRALGPGLLENSYEECLSYELRKSGFEVERQKALPLIYEEVKLESGYRIDLMVNSSVIVEVKAVETLLPVHWAQVITYLRLSRLELGMLVNFNVKLLKDGMHRVVLSRDK
jgi:GxxExxY protein